MLSRQYAVPVVLMLLAYLAYVINLDDLILWGDEGWTMETARSAVGVLINERLAEDIHPPLYFVGAHYWIALTGDSIFAMRYLSALLGMLAAAVIYRLCLDLFDAQTAVIAVGLYIVHDLVMVLTREVRHYALMLLLCSAVLLLFQRFWRHPRPRHMIALSVASACLLLTHYWGGLLIAALGLFYLFSRPRKVRWLLAYAGLTTLLFLPWVPSLVHQLTIERPDGIPHSIPNDWNGFRTLAFQLGGTPEVLWIGLAIIGMSAFAFMRTKPGLKEAMLAMAVCLPLATTLIINEFYAASSFRALAVIVPGLVVLWARALIAIETPQRYLFAAVLFVHSLATIGAGPQFRLPWDDVVDHLQTRVATESVVMIGVVEEPIAAYEFRQAAINYRQTFGGDDRANFEEALRDADGQPIWTLNIEYPFGDFGPLLLAAGYVPTAPTESWQPSFGNDIVLRRWEVPQLERAIATFANSATIHTLDWAARDDALVINTQWSMTTPDNIDYTISFFLLDSGGVLVSQLDRPPHLPTSQWSAGQPIAVNHVVGVGALPAGAYTLGALLYTLQNGAPVNVFVTPCAETEPCRFILLESVTLAED